MEPAATHESNLQTRPSEPSIAVEMGTLQPQASPDSQEQTGKGPHAKPNSQTLTTTSNIKDSPQLPSLDVVSSQPSEPARQRLSAPERQSKDEVPGLGGVNTSERHKSQSEVGEVQADRQGEKETDSSTSRAVKIILLLPNGSRHTLHIDENYLKERKISVDVKDPFLISIYTLKELILRDWREEWSAKPSAPAAIRLIHFGRLLDDKQSLNECRFNVDTPNVVHMAVKPQDLVDEDDPKAAKGIGRDRDGEDRTVGCRCVVL